MWQKWLGIMCLTHIIITLLNLHERVFNFLAQETIRLEILQQFPLHYCISSVTTLKDEVFLLGKRDGQCHTITVYDRSNMAEVKDVIPLPRLRAKIVAACSVSNYLYVLSSKRHRCSIVRVGKDGEHWSAVTPLISGIYLEEPTLSVTDSGSLITSGQQTSNDLPVISVWDANGSMQREIRFSEDFSEVISFFWHILPKSNGNLVLAVADGPNRLMEINLDGIVIRQYDFMFLSLDYKCVTSYADRHGRIFNINYFKEMELFDAEFNRIDFTGPELPPESGGHYFSPEDMHYNCARNELVAIVCNQDGKGVLVFFHFTGI